ncbi:hypothetical protein N7G274_000962 [Stereocaulon virgatum]|uniref:Uncharacterized protein n=1 Tax=Stereocaulon virgatum TaxID=373712 RepID=A0ABR4AN42_9LECA
MGHQQTVKTPTWPPFRGGDECVTNVQDPLRRSRIRTEHGFKILCEMDFRGSALMTVLFPSPKPPLWHWFPVVGLSFSFWQHLADDHVFVARLAVLFQLTNVAPAR